MQNIVDPTWSLTRSEVSRSRRTAYNHRRQVRPQSSRHGLFGNADIELRSGKTSQIPFIRARLAWPPNTTILSSLRASWIEAVGEHFRCRRRIRELNLDCSRLPHKLGHAVIFIGRILFSRAYPLPFGVGHMDQHGPSHVANNCQPRDQRIHHCPSTRAIYLKAQFFEPHATHTCRALYSSAFFAVF